MTVALTAVLVAASGAGASTQADAEDTAANSSPTASGAAPAGDDAEADEETDSLVPGEDAADAGTGSDTETRDDDDGSPASTDGDAGGQPGDGGAPSTGGSSGSSAGGGGGGDGGGGGGSGGDTPTETPTETSTETPGSNETDGDRDAESVEVVITCEDDRPFIYNNNSFEVDVLVDGPNGEESYDLGPGIDVGGPQPPSHMTPSMPPGEYEVTAVDLDGNSVPVNGEATYTTTVKECPTAGFTTTCADENTSRVTFEADNMTERHDRPVTIEIRSADESIERETTVQPTDGTVDFDFNVSDAADASIEAHLDQDGPTRLAETDLGAGRCDDAGGEAGAGPMESLEVVVVCERDMPFIYNPNGKAATVTIDGPNGEEEWGVGPGQDRGGPSVASHQSPSTPPGEYTITAVDQDGNSVPVNGEETYTTTVKECPTSSVQAECVDGDTAQVSFSADNLTGRHAVPITADFLSGNPDNPEQFTIQPEDGVATSEFEVNTTGQVLVQFEFQDASETPSRLDDVSFDAGDCADAAPPPDDTPAPGDSDDDGEDASTPGDEDDAGDADDTPTETDGESGTDESTPSESDGDTEETTDTDTETESTESEDTETEDTGTEDTGTGDAEMEDTESEDAETDGTTDSAATTTDGTDATSGSGGSTTESAA